MAVSRMGIHMDDSAVPDMTTGSDFSAKMAAIEKYLSRGWALVPLHYIRGDDRCSCGTDCGKSAGKHPIRPAWQRDVQRDLTAWSGIAFASNVGIATGAPSGFWVLDYDLSAAGPEADAIVARLHDAGLPSHVRTGGGGTHWRFRLPTDFEVTNRRGTLPAGYDVRGTGGQVVAPPSVSGKGAYVELPTSGDGMPYEPPDWLLDMIRPAVPLPRGEPPAGWSPILPSGGAVADDRGQRYAAAAVADMLAELAATPANRNDLAWRYACRILEFVNAGWIDLASVDAALVDAITAHPLGIVVPQSEVMSILGSAQRHVGDRPAELPPEWTDPLRVEVWPSPPADAAGVPPFSPSSNGAASAYQVPAFSEPGMTSTSVNGRGAASPVPDAPTFDPLTEVEINRAMRSMVAREQATERLRQLRAGNRAAIVARLRVELLDTSALLARPELVPIVEGLLYRRTVARINGAPAAGKTFTTVDLSARVAAGMTWAGRRTTRTTVAYVLAEGAGGMARRIRPWQTYHGRDVEVLWLPRAVQIGTPEWEAWCDVLIERETGLLVLDTQARATVGRDEIDGRDMGEVLGALDEFAQRADACALLVHHTPVGGTRARGHGSMTGGLQTEMLTDKTGRAITVKITKSKDDDESDPLIFDLTDVATPTVPGFSEPSGRPATLGVVPVWREVAAVAEGAVAGEPVRRTRARGLWLAIHGTYRLEGGTRAEIRQLFADRVVPDMATTGPRASTFRKAWADAWADLIALGLIAKAFGEARFAVVVVKDQSGDGVLTTNRREDGHPLVEPDGYEVRGIGDPGYAE